MDREFLDLYNRELQLLSEQAREFAEEYPGIAERLGGILEDRTDPMVSGLLEGAAFLAARVQLKLKHEFPEFTNNLLEQLVPRVRERGHASEGEHDNRAVGETHCASFNCASGTCQ